MPPLQTLLPFGVGFALGIAVTAVIMRTLLHKHESATTGVLLGLLLGAVLGLWPFRVGVPPQVGDVVRGQTLTTVEQRDEVKPKYWHGSFYPESSRSHDGDHGRGRWLWDCFGRRALGSTAGTNQPRFLARTSLQQNQKDSARTICLRRLPHEPHYCHCFALHHHGLRTILGE